MSVKELKFVGINKMTCEIKPIEKDGFTDLEFKFYDRNDHTSYLFIDRSQAHLLMLYLQEHLNGSQVNTELDQAITDEIKNKPKDIM